MKAGPPKRCGTCNKVIGGPTTSRRYCSRRCQQTTIYKQQVEWWVGEEAVMLATLLSGWALYKDQCREGDRDAILRYFAFESGVALYLLNTPPSTRERRH